MILGLTINPLYNKYFFYENVINVQYLFLYFVILQVLKQSQLAKNLFELTGSCSRDENWEVFSDEMMMERKDH